MINQEFKMGDITDQIRGVSYKKDVFRKEPFGGYIPILRANNIRDDFKIDTEDLIYVPKEFVKESQILREGDVVIAASSGSKKVVGKAAGFDLPQNFSFGAFCKVIRPKSTKVRVKFLWYYFQSYRYRTLISELAAGANILNIRNSHLNDIVFSAPEDLEEQDNIITALDKANSIIDKRQKSIVLLDELLRATFLDMFGDIASDKENSERRLLGDFIEIKHGYAFKSKYFVDNGDFVLLTPGNFYEKGGFKNRGDKQKYYNGEFSKEYLLDRGDLLVAMTEQSPGLLGSPILIPDNDRFLHNQRLGLVKFKSNVVNKIFLYCLFNTEVVRDIIHNKATGLKVRHTSPSKIENIYVSIPDRAQQEHFEKIFNTINIRVQDLRRSKSLALNLFQSLLQRAFHGDLALDIELQLDAFIDNENLQAIEKDDVLIQLLIDRFEAHNMGKEDIKDSNGESENGYHFESLESYEKAKHALFHLLKKEKVVQQYDAENNKTSLSLP